MNLIKSLTLVFVGFLMVSGRTLNAQIVVVVNRDNPVMSIGMTELKRIYLSEITHWRSNDVNNATIILIDYRHKSKIATKFYTKLTGYSHSRVRLEWIGKMLNGEIQKLPVNFDSDDDILKFISKNRWCIGFVNSSSFDSLMTSLKSVQIDGKNYNDKDYPLREGK